MKKMSKIKNILIATSILSISLIGEVKAYPGKVSTETLYLRNKPSTDSNIISLLNEGEDLDIISEEGDWYKVKYKDKEGYTNKKYIKTDKKNEYNKPKEEVKENKKEEVKENKKEGNKEVKDENSYIQENNTIKIQKDTEIRILPLINSNVLEVAHKEEILTEITRVNNWIFVEKGDITGWIVNNTNNKENKEENIKENIKTEEEIKKEDVNKENKVEENNKEDNENKYTDDKVKYVNSSSVYMRRKPTTDSDIVTTLIKNTDVKVLGESGEWYKVKFKDKEGYIRKDLLSDKKIEETNRSNAKRNIDKNNVIETSSNQNKGNQIVSYAKQYLGAPYVYGGSGSKSFDCSGFTMYAYKHFGYDLRHSAVAQSKLGTKVEKENLQPGDLVFFLDYETMDGIGHCGIYIGDGNFIHASSGSGHCVKISTLLSGSYQRRYAGARRLI